MLKVRLSRIIEEKSKNKIKEARLQHGSGERGDKIRTYRVTDDLVTDHRLGKKTSLKNLYKGNWLGIK